MQKGVRTLVGSLLFWGVLCFVPSVHAMSVSPVRQTITIDKNQETTIDITVKNTSNKSHQYRFDVSPFEIDEQTGRAVFGSTDPAVHWVVPPADMTLAAGESKKATFHIVIPKTAEPGGHYLGLFAEQQSGEGQIGVGAKLGSLLFLYIAGDVHESMSMEEIHTAQSWYIRKNPNISVVLKNNGTIHLTPEVSVSIKKGAETIQTKALNPNGRKVLPQGTWKEFWDIQDLQLAHGGKITAEVEVTYGIHKQKIKKAVSFWYVPIELAIITAVVSGLIVLFVIHRVVQKK